MPQGSEHGLRLIRENGTFPRSERTFVVPLGAARRWKSSRSTPRMRVDLRATTTLVEEVTSGQPSISPLGESNQTIRDIDKEVKEGSSLPSKRSRDQNICPCVYDTCMELRVSGYNPLKRRHRGCCIHCGRAFWVKPVKVRKHNRTKKPTTILPPLTTTFADWSLYDTNCGGTPLP
jgi:hypothetical protein